MDLQAIMGVQAEPGAKAAKPCAGFPCSPDIFFDRQKPTGYFMGQNQRLNTLDLFQLLAE